MPDLPPPSEMGLPEKYTSWRQNQDTAVLRIIDAERPFITQIAPTGFGKSLAYVSAAHLSSNRAVILTSTKALQTQLLHDFADLGIADIRGRNAYSCKAEHDGSRCDHGPCIAGYNCPLREGGCTYFDAYRRALNASIVITNYSYWMFSHAYGEGLGRVDTMICDEAHNLPNVVSDFLILNLDRTDTFTETLLPTNMGSMNQSAWALWAGKKQPIVDTEIEYLKERIRRGGNDRTMRRFLSRSLALSRTLNILKGIDENWIIDVSKHVIQFSPVWPKKYTKSVLFFSIPKIILTSATVCAKTAEMAGIPVECNELMEFPHSFPVENRLLIHVPTVRMNKDTDAMGLRKWYSRIDQILRQRQDRKGVIHTVSYDRRNIVMSKSKFSKLMITHNRGDAIQQVAKFKRGDPPLYLVSPSVTTGYDFPDDECRFQIIGKLGYPDTRNKITAARVKEDKDYGAYVAMMELVQACGRSVRSKTDWSENLMIDDSLKWFIPKYGRFAPKWFLKSVRWVQSIPKPPVLD